MLPNSFGNVQNFEHYFSIDCEIWRVEFGGAVQLSAAGEGDLLPFSHVSGHVRCSEVREQACSVTGVYLIYTSISFFISISLWWVIGLYGLWKIGISKNGGNIKNLHQSETQKLFFFHKQTPFQNIKAHFAYLIVMMMICTRVRVRGERVRASGAAWPLQRCRVEQRTRDHRHRTLHCCWYCAGTAAWVRGL